MKYISLRVGWMMVVLFASLSLAAQVTTFKLRPVNLGNGYMITGTIATDGTVGYLSASNFVKWNISVTQTTDMVFDETNTTALNVSQVSTDGKKIYVPTSPDGFTDGGSLNFLGGGGRGGILTGALVGDFMGWNAAGGVSGWQTPLALNYLSLNEPNASRYTAATVTNNPKVFRMRPVTITTTPTLMTMFGTITTDGTVGPLAAANFKSWHIVGRDQDIQNYNENNSQILNVLLVSSNNTTLTVANPGGMLQIGLPMVSVRGRPIMVTLADFTDPAYVNGVASYYYSWQGLVASKSPLTKDATWLAGHK